MLRTEGQPFGENPLAGDSPHKWYDLIEKIDPASLLVAIESRMSAALRSRLQPEDILQESLLFAWRDRSKCQWRGLRSFRSWLLTIIDNQIRAAADHHGALKRGGGQESIPLSPGRSDNHDSRPVECDPWLSTTPSRLAMHRERSATILEVLAGLPPELGPVVRMRLIEQRPVEEIASLMHISEAAVRHRVRKGAEIYRQRLTTLLSTRPRVTHRESRSN